MDKIAANNHFVTLKKEIKKAKAMVSGKLIRRIKELNKETEGAEDETKISKIQNKIDSIHGEIKLLKTLDSYIIAKQATLKPGKEHWNKLASHSKASPAERLTALVICKNNIQKQISKFREDQKDCDEWLTEYIEYREKKNELVNPGKRLTKVRGKGPIKLSKPMNATKERGPNKSRERANKSEDPRHEKPREIKREHMDSSPNDMEDDDKETLHPSWESKRKQKELLKAAMSGQFEQSKRVTFD